MLFPTGKTRRSGCGTCVKCARTNNTRRWPMTTTAFVDTTIGKRTRAALSPTRTTANFVTCRSGHYPKPKHLAHPLDCSVMTYRGHAVLQTLIRCHFSPAETTGGQYIYSGSADGRIHVRITFIGFSDHTYFCLVLRSGHSTAG